MKTSFNDLSIKYKIIITVTLLFSIIFFSLSLFVYFYSKKEFSQDLKNSISIIGAVTAENIAGAVAFNDKDAINQTLSSLKFIKELNYIEVLDTNNNPITKYSLNDLENENFLSNVRKINKLSISNFGKYLVIIQPITFQNQILGKIIMVFNKTYFNLKFTKFIIYEFLIFFAILLLSFLILLFLQKKLTTPIIQLTETIKNVMKNNDFTVRLKNNSKDEYGTLIIAFNHLLNHIEIQNKILIESQQKALQLAKVKELFLAHMSHEIRTPLNAIYGFIILLSETKLSEKQKLYLHYIKTSLENLQVIINDILDFSKIEAGKLKIKKQIFDLHSLLNELKQVFTPKAKEKKIDLLLEIDKNLPQFIIGDKIRLNQILINLIGNAIKFTETGYVKLKVDVKNKQDKSITLFFKVIDTGIGIKKEKLNNIFEEFQQADHEIATKYGGTGLGLAITQKLLKLQNGKIFVESEYKKGSTFAFEITYDLPTSEEIKEFVKKKEKENIKSTKIKNLKGIKILIVEDNKINQILLKKILTKYDAKITVASNGKEAISAVEKDYFDLIFMDINLPEMNGFEAAKYIKTKINNVLKQQIPIVALTAAVTEDEKNKAEKAGMAFFISKPFKENEIIDIIIKLVKK